MDHYRRTNYEWVGWLIFGEKIFTDSPKTMKFAEVFSIESLLHRKFLAVYIILSYDRLYKYELK